MSIGINSLNNANVYKGIDFNNSNIAETTNKIFERANAKTVDLNKVDLTGFNRQTLGTELYSQKTDIQTLNTIAQNSNNATLNLQGAQGSIAYLNSQVAALSYANKPVNNNVEGKIAIALNEADGVSLREVFSLPATLELNPSKNLDKDKRGSNPFAFYQPSQGSANSEENSANATESLSLYA